MEPNLKDPAVSIAEQRENLCRMSNFGPDDLRELRGVESRSLVKLRALAIATQQNLAGAIDEAARQAGANVRDALSLKSISNQRFEQALEQATPRPGLRSPRPLGPVDTGSLALLREIMLLADCTMPQALADTLLQAGVTVVAGRRIAELSVGQLHAALEHQALLVRSS